jgi:hypothetical protein
LCCGVVAAGEMKFDVVVIAGDGLSLEGEVVAGGEISLFIGSELKVVAAKRLRLDGVVNKVVAGGESSLVVLVGCWVLWGKMGVCLGVWV